MHYILLCLLTVSIFGLLCFLILSIFLGCSKSYYIWRKTPSAELQDIAQQNLARFLAPK